MSTISELTVSAGGLRFRCLHAGGGDRLALLVHGFPDDAGTWSQLLPALAQAGYHAIAPWTRGYGETERAEPAFLDVGETARAVLAVIGSEPIHIDEAASAAGLRVAEVSAALVELELAGVVRAVGAMRFVRS